MRRAARILLAVFFVVAGLNHFRDPAFYQAMIPGWLPAPAAMNLISGIAEILGGLGVLPAATRRFAGIGLVLLLVAVFPANIAMAVGDPRPPWADIPSWLLWARLPLQGVLIAWVWWTAISRPAVRADA